MPQSYGFIFISARDFWEKLLKKFGPHVLSGKNLRHLRYLRDYTSRKSDSSTEQVAFRLIRA